MFMTLKLRMREQTPRRKTTELMLGTFNAEEFSKEKYLRSLLDGDDNRSLSGKSGQVRKPVSGERTKYFPVT